MDIAQLAQGLGILFAFLSFALGLKWKAALRKLSQFREFVDSVDDALKDGALSEDELKGIIGKLVELLGPSAKVAGIATSRYRIQAINPPLRDWIDYLALFTLIVGIMAAAIVALYGFGAF